MKNISLEKEKVMTKPNPKTYTLKTIATIILSYLFLSFALAELNPFNWSEIVRLGFVVIAIITIDHNCSKFKAINKKYLNQNDSTRS